MLAFIASLLALLPAASPVPARDDARYWAFADRIQARLDSLWDERAGRYQPGTGGVETTFNANLLVAHSVAALRGHRGRARDDHRARMLVRALLASPPYAARRPPAIATSQLHAPGWVSSMRSLRASQHVMIDAEVIDGLVHAWLARRQLGLAPATARLIARRIHGVARGWFWRYPAIRLNQFNWHARIYTADAIVTGDHTLVRRDLRLQLERFVAGARGTAAHAGNLGPGLRFHYFPERPVSEPGNVDSAEYGSLTASFTRFYGEARRRGMAPLAPAGRHIVRRWLRRVVTGYWTHSGYLNWDSGLGFRRWHQAKKLGLTQQALIGIASAPELAGPRMRAWAKWILDRGFAFYERQAARAGGLAPGTFFGVGVVPQGRDDERLAAARMLGNAGRAVAAGLGAAPSSRPPALYAYDPDTGRLAVTTPAYNTAVVPVSQGAFPYGGIELARLFDSDQEVAGGIGGRPPAAFGLLVRDRSGRRVLATQLPSSRLSRQVTPLRLTRAPAGTAATASTTARRAYARAFADLRAAGSVRSSTLVAHTAHRFTPEFVETRWTLRRRAGRARYSIDLLFPSWGSAARIVAVRRDGSRTEVGARRSGLTDVAYLHVQSEHSGYVVVPREGPAGATAHALTTTSQSSAPNPGPTLALQLARDGHVRRTSMTVRLAPARDIADAAEMAARLSAR